MSPVGFNHEATITIVDDVKNSRPYLLDIPTLAEHEIEMMPLFPMGETSHSEGIVERLMYLGKFPTKPFAICLEMLFLFHAFFPLPFLALIAVSAAMMP
jgi:hypothetical protein